MIPGAVLGVALESFFDTFFREHIILVAVFLVLGAGDPVARGAAGVPRSAGLDNVNIRDAIVIGVAQAFALFPGFSRSGMTIAAGLYTGLDPRGGRALLVPDGHADHRGRGGWKARELLQTGLPSADVLALGVGMLGAAVAGLLAIAFLLDYLRRRTTAPFIAERLVMAALVVVFVLAR